MKYLKYSLLFSLFLIFRVAAQDGNAAISGKVFDAATKQAVNGASVGIPGISSAITDAKGEFELRKSAKDANLQVKAQGYATKIVPLRGETYFEIYLYEADFVNAVKTIDLSLGEGLDLTSPAALADFNTSTFKKRGVVSAEELLYGGSGLNAMARTGAVGSGTNVYLRGFNSLNANTQPLIVLDGMPFNNMDYGTSIISGSITTALSFLDAKDIESITVLKDGTSLYGSRGANGVILIKTIKPDQIATRINFYAYMGVNMKPLRQYDMLGADEYRSYLAEMLQSSGLYTQKQLEVLPYLNREQPRKKEWGWEGNVDYYRYNQETNWQDQVFTNSLNQNYYIDIKGGDEVALFALSLGFLKHQGIISGTDFSRYTARFNSRFNMGRRLVLHSNMGFNYGDKHLKDEGLVSTNPLIIALNKAPFMTTYYHDVLNRQSKTLEEADLLGISNPYSALNNTDIQSKKYRFDANLRPTYSLNKHFSLNALFGLTTDKTSERTFYPRAGMSYPDHRLGAVFSQMGRRSLRFYQLYAEGFLRYNQEINKLHHLSAATGFRYQSNDVEEDYSLGYNSPTDDMKTVGSGNADFEYTGGMLNNWKWLSYYIQAEYSLKNRYFFNVNASLDGSSNYGKETAKALKLFNTPFASFVSGSAAWLISSEEFMSSIDWISRAKLRLSMGSSGNDDMGSSYKLLKYYESVAFLGQYGAVRGNIPNTELQWETAIKRNVGLDLQFLDERLGINVDLYSNTTQNLLCVKTLSSQAGIKNYLTNDGSLSNKGYELAVQGRLINSVFKWDLGLQVSHYTNRLESYADEKTETLYAGATILTKVGQPLGLFYGHKTEGVYSNQDQAEVAGLSTLSSKGVVEPFAAGDVRFVNMDDDPLIDLNDRVVIGDPNPDLFGSIHSSMSWKNFSLQVLFTYSLGNDIYNALRHNLEAMEGSTNQTKAVLNRWRTDDHHTLVPKALWGDPMGNARFSDRWIEDGSFMKLKTLTLSYQVPLSKTTGILQGLELYVTGNNLFTLTRYLGYDPEFNISQNPLYYGIDTGVTPLAASVLFGLRIAL